MVCTPKYKVLLPFPVCSTKNNDCLAKQLEGVSMLSCVP